jgi:hypothetical protein
VNRFADLTLTILFSAELLLQVLHHGGVRAWSRDGWNILDGVIVAAALAALLATVSSGSIDSGSGGAGGMLAATKGIRTLRVLRPLRALKRFPRLRATVDTITMALPVTLGEQISKTRTRVCPLRTREQLDVPPMDAHTARSTVLTCVCVAGVVTILLFFWIVLAACGSMLLADVLRECVDAPHAPVGACPGRLTPAPFNMDTTINALLTQFALFKLDGWGGFAATAFELLELKHGSDAGGYKILAALCACSCCPPRGGGVAPSAHPKCLLHSFAPRRPHTRAALCTCDRRDCVCLLRFGLSDLSVRGCGRRPIPGHPLLHPPRRSGPMDRRAA